MHSLLLTKENLQTRIKPLSNDSVRNISRQNTHAAGGAGLKPIARKHVVSTYLPLDHLPSPPKNHQGNRFQVRGHNFRISTPDPTSRIRQSRRRNRLPIFRYNSIFFKISLFDLSLKAGLNLSCRLIN
jgi:hypothetical protein